MWKKIGGLLSVIAAVCAIVGFVLKEILHKTFAEIFVISLTFPLWVILIVLVSIAILCIIIYRHHIKSSNKPDPQNLVCHKHLHEITSKRRESATSVSSKFLRSPIGSIATWVYLQPFGEGIRRLENNRYIVAHDTNGGVTKQIGSEQRYINVFSLSRGPKRYSPPSHPAWKLWLANGNGESKVWFYDDSEELKPGWHHFLIRYDHGQPLLELLIDGKSVIQCNDYRKYWPFEYDSQILLGTWTNRAPIHFIETFLWRTIFSYNFLDDAWLNRELAIPQPQLP